MTAKAVSGVFAALMVIGLSAGLLPQAGMLQVHAQTPPAMEMPAFDDVGALVFPDGYREWQFVSAGHGMNYNENGAEGRELPFDNVFVQRGAYAAFKRTGHWPEGTMLILEIRGGSGAGSINRHGSFQTGEPRAIEVHVRDARFEGGWAFFAFGGGGERPGPAPMIARTASCYSCHEQHAAVDTTFVQFYPTLLPVARNKGTLSAHYLAEEAAADRD